MRAQRLPDIIARFVGARNRRGACALGVLMLVGGLPAEAAERGELTDDTVVVKTEGAHRLLLPQDWPVVQRADGVIAPASLEEYLSLKFGQVRAALERTERRHEQLERRLEALEAAQETTDRRLRWLEEAGQQQAEREPMNNSTGGP